MSNYRRLFIPNNDLFITVVTNNRQPILVDNIELLRESFKRAKQTYNFEIFASVILPDHMHFIIHPENIDEYPKIIFAIKYHFARNVNVGGVGTPPYNVSQSKGTKGEKGVWQRRYWEHTIRDEDDLYKHLDYIHYNPVKHAHSKNVKDWEFSSFEKFVERGNYETSWGTTEDVKHIAEMKLD